jgi:hypothetical protein
MGDLLKMEVKLSGLNEAKAGYFWYLGVPSDWRAERLVVTIVEKRRLIEKITSTPLCSKDHSSRRDPKTTSLTPKYTKITRSRATMVRSVVTSIRVNCELNISRTYAWMRQNDLLE